MNRYAPPNAMLLARREVRRHPVAAMVAVFALLQLGWLLLGASRYAAAMASGEVPPEVAVLTGLSCLCLYVGVLRFAWSVEQGLYCFALAAVGLGVTVSRWSSPKHALVLGAVLAAVGCALVVWQRALAYVERKRGQTPVSAGGLLPSTEMGPPLRKAWLAFVGLYGVVLVAGLVGAIGSRLSWLQAAFYVLDVFVLYGVSAYAMGRPIGNLWLRVAYLVLALSSVGRAGVLAFALWTTFADKVGASGWTVLMGPLFGGVVLTTLAAWALALYALPRR